MSRGDTAAVRTLTTDSAMGFVLKRLGRTLPPDSLVADALRLRSIDFAPTGGTLYFEYTTNVLSTTAVELVWRDDHWRVANYPPLVEW